MAISPQTNLKLLKCPLTLDNKNQLTFANKQAQYNYFNSLQKIEVDEISYVRKNSVLYYPEHIDNLLEYNYCMYQNENYGDKWFYAFITNMRYITDGNTEITIATDVYQTWQFDLNFKQSFVEREMINLNEDVAGSNLVPESLETGEYKISATSNFDELLPVAVVCYTRNPYEDGFTNQQPTARGVIANGIPNGMYFCICSFDMLQGLLQSINSAGYGESILTIFTVPASSLIGFNNWTLTDITTGGILWWLVTDFKANPITKTLSPTPQNLDGYIPRNQKLKTYPYCYLGFNPPNGSSKIYRYENFENGVPVFKIISEINQNPNIVFIPQNYRGTTGDNLSDSSNLGGYPTIGWITDYYNTWLAQNSGIIEIQNRQEDYNYRHNQAITNAQNTMGAIGTIVNSVSSILNGNISGRFIQQL